MSVDALSWAFKQELPCMQKFVLVALADHCNKDGQCWPSQTTLARKCGISRQHVNEMIAKLRATKHVVAFPRQHANGGVKSSVYFLNMPESTLPTGAVVDVDMGLSTGDDTPLSATPTANKKNRKKEPPIRNAALPGLEYPDWLPREKFERFVDSRKKMRKAMTDHAIDLMIDSLDELRRAGHDIGKLLDLAVRKGWTDVYAPNDPRDRQTAQQATPSDEWMIAVRIYFEGTTFEDGYGGTKKAPPGTWASKLGPKPDAPGHRVPPEVIAAYTVERRERSLPAIRWHA
jgi:hypothetical protein